MSLQRFSKSFCATNLSNKRVHIKGNAIVVCVIPRETFLWILTVKGSYFQKHLWMSVSYQIIDHSFQILRFQLLKRVLKFQIYFQA